MHYCRLFSVHSHSPQPCPRWSTADKSAIYVKPLCQTPQQPKKSLPEIDFYGNL